MSLESKAKNLREITTVQINYITVLRNSRDKIQRETTTNKLNEMWVPLEEAQRIIKLHQKIIEGLNSQVVKVKEILKGAILDQDSKGNPTAVYNSLEIYQQLTNLFKEVK